MRWESLTVSHRPAVAGTGGGVIVHGFFQFVLGLLLLPFIWFADFVGRILGTEKE